MAAKKKTPAKTPEKFAVLWSECQDDSQLELLDAGRDDKTFFPSMQAAKQAADFDTKENDLSGRFIIVKVVAEGNTVGDISWQ